jgi:histidinol-phosphate aminotransferase
MTVRPEVSDLPAYSFTASDCPVKLDQNESPHDLPEGLKDEVVARLREIAFHRYPEMHADSLRAALARRHGWSERGVVVANGSNVLIGALVQACGIGRRVVTVKPTFSIYPLQARLLGAALTEVALAADFSLPLDALEAELASGQGVLFIANPAAPTGNLLPTAELRALAAAARGWTVVIDEAYAQFAGSDMSLLVRDYPHVASLRTMSKAFGLGGVRLGYMLAQPALAGEIQKVLLPFSVSALQVAVGLTVLGADDYVSARVEETLLERARVAAALAELGTELGLHVFPSHTNFLLFRVPDAAGFYGGLKARGVLIRRQDGLHGLSGCLRVSVGTRAENDAFIAAARAVAETYVVKAGEAQHV